MTAKLTCTVTVPTTIDKTIFFNVIQLVDAHSDVAAMVTNDPLAVRFVKEVEDDADILEEEYNHFEDFVRIITNLLGPITTEIEVTKV